MSHGEGGWENFRSSLLMITLVTKKVSIDGFKEQQILSEHFSWTKISSTTSKMCAWKHGFTLYFT